MFQMASIHKDLRQSKQSVNRPVISPSRCPPPPPSLFILSFHLTSTSSKLSQFIRLSVCVFVCLGDIITYGNVDQLRFVHAWLDEKGGPPIDDEKKGIFCKKIN